MRDIRRPTLIKASGRAGPTILAQTQLKAATTATLAGLDGNAADFWRLIVDVTLFNASADTLWLIRFNNDSGNNYQGGQFGMAYTSSGNAIENARFTPASAVNVRGGGWSSPAQFLTEFLISPASGKYRGLNYRHTWRRTNAADYGLTYFGGWWWRNSSDKITTINFDFQSVQTTGRIWLLGIQAR